MRPKCRIQARGQKGGPNLGLQHTIDTTRGAIARQAGGYHASQDLRSRWDMATASGDLCKLTCLTLINTS